MKAKWSKADDPNSWDTDGGSVWMGHPAIARAIVRFLGWLERVRLALRRFTMTIDGEEVTFREGRWCCSCHWFSEEGACEHELQAIERAIKEGEAGIKRRP